MNPLWERLEVGPPNSFIKHSPSAQCRTTTGSAILALHHLYSRFQHMAWLLRDSLQHPQMAGLYYHRRHLHPMPSISGMIAQGAL